MQRRSCLLGLRNLGLFATAGAALTVLWLMHTSMESAAAWIRSESDTGGASHVLGVDLPWLPHLVGVIAIAALIAIRARPLWGLLPACAAAALAGFCLTSPTSSHLLSHVTTVFGRYGAAATALLWIAVTTMTLEILSSTRPDVPGLPQARARDSR
jgi:hypothetical protein